MREAGRGLAGGLVPRPRRLEGGHSLSLQMPVAVKATAAFILLRASPDGGRFAYDFSVGR